MGSQAPLFLPLYDVRLIQVIGLKDLGEDKWRLAPGEGGWVLIISLGDSFGGCGVFRMSSHTAHVKIFREVPGRVVVRTDRMTNRQIVTTTAEGWLAAGLCPAQSSPPPWHLMGLDPWNLLGLQAPCGPLGFYGPFSSPA